MPVKPGSIRRRVVWKPHKGPQTEFLSRNEDEILYGGARGGGKSEASLMGALRHVSHSDYKAIFFRRTFPTGNRACSALYHSRAVIYMNHAVR